MSYDDDDDHDKAYDELYDNGDDWMWQTRQWQERHEKF